MCANNDCDNIMIIDKGLASWAPDRDPPSNQQILESDQNTTSCKNSTIEHLAALLMVPDYYLFWWFLPDIGCCDIWHHDHWTEVYAPVQFLLASSPGEKVRLESVSLYIVTCLC